ncbi:transcriptional repressor [Leclercia barmai]|uniref:transcriptional repressor n=1 Tax=Leclercia barmai TaxID=2785629 RepID=UPI003BB85FBE|nr:hypothetical protein [Enterobacter hormaechei subsp. steigerwaltii]
MLRNLNAQEVAVVNAIDMAGDEKLTAVDVYNSLRSSNKIAQSTVYNILRRLVHNGVLRKVLTLSNDAFYEIKKIKKTKHISFIYPRKITELTDARLDILISQIAAEIDAKMLDYEISLILK